MTKAEHDDNGRNCHGWRLISL